MTRTWFDHKFYHYVELNTGAHFTIDVRSYDSVLVKDAVIVQGPHPPSYESEK